MTWAVKHRGVWKAAAVILAVFFTVCSAGFAVQAQTVQAQEDSLFTEEEKALIERGETLKVGYVRDRKPVSFRGDDGELAGISRSIFDRIAQISGLHFEYVELPAGEVTYDYLVREGFDLVTGVEYNDENKAARGILISEPYLSSRKVIVAREGLVNIGEDAEYTVAISTGSQTIKKVLARQYPNFVPVDYDTIEDCMDAVNRGEADLMIQNQYVVEYWLYKPSYSSLMVIPMTEFADRLCFSAVTPLEKDNGEWEEKRVLISVIDKAIAQISYAEVAGYVIASTTANMYQYSISDFVYQYRYTVILLGVAVALLCGMVCVTLHFRIRSIRAQADAKAKGDFLSAMSHEIRTPLNGLISLNYLMAQNVDDREKISGYLQQSSTVAQYLLSLVNNVLDMSKLQQSRLELEQKPVDLELLLETIESVEKDGMRESGISFCVETGLSRPGIMGDAVRIQQVLLNLLDNARKYTKPGGSVTVKADQTETEEGVVLTKIQVLDTGQGMSEEFQKKIFSPFTQERNTVSQGNQGTGLGLSVCHLLAERMGGSLTVESRLNEGSCFTFTFPAQPVSSAAADIAADRDKDGLSSVKPHVLIAEDNELNGQILAELLEGEGYEVLHVENGKKAVEAFAASPVGKYGVILMDLLMPEMNGFEAARAIRGLERPDAGTVKIFASTANTFPEDREKAFESGMDDFIAKPINIRELLKKLQFQDER